MYEFTELEWLNKSLRGREFGFHGTSTVYLKGRHNVVHVRTGSMSEDDVRFRIGASIPGFGPQYRAVFAESPDAETGLDYSTMYLTEDGVDPRSNLPTGHPQIPRKPRVNAALKPNTDYYLTVDIVSAGPDGWEPTIPLTYTGTDYAGQYPIEAGPVVPPSMAGVNMVIEGVPGTWTPNT